MKTIDLTPSFLTGIEPVLDHSHRIGVIWRGYLGWWASPVTVGQRPEVFPTRAAAVDYLKEVA